MDIQSARQSLTLAENRMADKALPAYIIDELLRRSLDDFEEAVTPSGKFNEVLALTRAALHSQDYIEVANGVTLLRLMLPRAKYGELRVGARFYLGDLATVVFTKGLNGALFNGRLYPHANDDQTVILIEKQEV